VQVTTRKRFFAPFFQVDRVKTNTLLLVEDLQIEHWTAIAHLLRSKIRILFEIKIKLVVGFPLVTFLSLSLDVCL
jgi:hypothetical protein